LWAMRLRRSVSNIVAVILLIVIAVAAVTVLYMWLSGVISLVYTNTSAIHVKVAITNASVVSNSSGTYAVTLVYNLPGSVRTSIALGELEFSNGTLICANSSFRVPSGVIYPGDFAKAEFICSDVRLSAGTPVKIVLVTAQGVQVTYMTDVSS